MSTQTDLSHEFADVVVNTRFEDLPTSAVETAKKSVLDTLGVILAASGLQPAVGAVAGLTLESGGKPESTVLGFGGKVPATMAAMTNGAMAHCLDFDDHAPEGHHPSSSIVPAAFALAEKIGGVSGKQMITAVAIGHDLFLRLRRNVSWRQDWHLTTVMGVFSAAAASCHVLGLNRDQTISAFGIAGMQSCGTMELAYGVGSDLRGMYAAFSTQGAVLAALLAQRGVTGTRSMFEGKAGLFNTYFDGKYDRAAMTQGLGRDFDGGSILFKPWPSCGASHAYVHATIELMKQHQVKLADIEQIKVVVGDFQEQLCQPIEGRRAPATLSDAKFSIPFCVAIAATRGALKVSDFTEAGLKDPAVLAAAKKVISEVDSKFDWKSTLPEGRVEMLLKDGRTLTRLGDDVPGSAHSPMSWDYIDEKFSSCAQYGLNKPSTAAIARAQQIARQLEHSADATELIRVLQ